ncbi:hypothetical protein [Candidatus Nitrospira bockiana]
MLVVMHPRGALNARGRHFPQGSDVEGLPGWDPNHVAMCLKRGILEARPALPDLVTDTDQTEEPADGVPSTLDVPVGMARAIDQVQTVLQTTGGTGKPTRKRR